jgi:NAD(P)H-dependent flavin oxidoreductase YrpB (nitropropane dioxygenase family)
MNRTCTYFCRCTQLEQNRQGPPVEVGREYAAAREQGDFDVAGVIAGESCALIHDIPPASEIVERIGAEAERVIRSHAATYS